MTSTTKAQTFTIEFSIDGGKTWHLGMEKPMYMVGEVNEFRSIVRLNQRRHGHGVMTRVIK